MWSDLGRLATVQRDDVDADKLRRDEQQILRWSATKSLTDNLTTVTGSLMGYMEEYNLLILW